MLTLAMDRPSRKTKVVNYCESRDFDDDEDFACGKAPPSKKTREDVRQQEHKKPSSKSSSQESNSQPAVSHKNRRPLDEKLHERDLEAAITLSLLRSADGLEEPSPTSKGEVRVPFPVDENTDPATLRRSNCSVDGTLLGLDKITAASKSQCSSARQRRTACEVQKTKFKEDDEDYEPKPTPDSESDDDFSEQAESEDEEFTVKKVSKAKKEKMPKSEKTKRPLTSIKEKQPLRAPKPKSQAVAPSPAVRSPAPESRQPASSTLSKPAVPLSPAGGTIPKWNPPGLIGKSPTSSQNPAVKSPGQGLRLGLSRRVRVKPLHPSVATH